MYILYKGRSFGLQAGLEPLNPQRSGYKVLGFGRKNGYFHALIVPLLDTDEHPILMILYYPDPYLTLNPKPLDVVLQDIVDQSGRTACHWANSVKFRV